MKGSLGVHRVAWFSLLVFVSLGYFLHGCDGCLKEERNALQQLLRSLDGPNATSEWGWVGKDCCHWREVECNYVTSRVIYLYISKGELGDGYPKWYPNVSLLAELKELRELDLHKNNIAGWINPQAFCEFKQFEALHLFGNSIRSSIHPCFCNMHSLNTLDLSSNRFHGKIPHCLGELHSLRYLDLSYNQFEGMLSLSIFAKLSNLSYLDLSRNYKLEVETESPSWVPPLKLEYLRLANCNVNKHSGSQIPSFMSTFHTLKELDLSHNSLVGSIPFGLFNNTLYILRLRSNRLSGTFPQPHPSVSSLIYELDISDNQIHGPLPTNISVLLPNLVTFNMSVNALQGSIPQSFGQVTSLIELYLAYNNLTGEIPHSLTKSETLEYLFLSHNNLRGNIFPGNFTLSSLKCLKLDNNGFTGMIPPSLAKSIDLMFLDVTKNNLSGIIPSWITNCSRLGGLLLGENHFNGGIPNQLCQMQDLQFLDLSSNSLSGNIPSCLNNISFWKNKSKTGAIFSIFLTFFNGIVPVDFTTKGKEYSFQGDPLYLMIGIDMSSNRLTGNIPNEMGDLRMLRSLNLSNNALVGSFPKSFQHLESLESLDLSHNKLTGIIPHEITQLYSLSTFSVAYNNLSGKIPSGSQFSTFSENSYKGNPSLCGQPLERNCTPIVSLEPPKNEEKEEQSGIADSPFFFYSCIAVSYVLGFWIVIAPLFFSHNWRRKYFRTVDKCIDLWVVKLYEVQFYLKNCGL